MKLDKICRACLEEKAYLKPLFDACLPNMLMTCASVQVMEGDGLPQQICTQCLLSLNKAYTFKHLCEKSDMTLRNYLQTISIQTENILSGVQKDLFSSSEVLQQNTIFEDIFTDATTQSLVESFNHNATTVASDLAETMQSLQTIAEQCLPETWENGVGLPTNSQEALDNFNMASLFKCHYCDDMFKDEWILGEHTKSHTNQNEYFCNPCNKVCSTSDELSKHLLEHTFGDDTPKKLIEDRHEQEVICSNCNSNNCKDSECQKGHLEAVSTISNNQTEKKIICDICGKSYKQRKFLSIHMRVHTGERPYNCEVCGRKFSLYSSLHKHRNIHSERKKFECKVCGKMFNQSSNLNNHLKIHTGNQNIIYIFIKIKFFTASSQVKKHRLIHTGEKPYACWQCGRTFRRKETRDTHVRYHTGERPYTCDICSKKYVAASHLREHMKTHNSERNFECAVCMKKFYTSKALKDHAAVHTGQKPYSCQHCGKQFTQNGAMHAHMKNCSSIVHDFISL
nr:unnamed protein product [Callosobruchus chinensis]